MESLRGPNDIVSIEQPFGGHAFLQIYPICFSLGHAILDKVLGTTCMSGSRFPLGVATELTHWFLSAALDAQRSPVLAAVPSPSICHAHPQVAPHP